MFGTFIKQISVSLYILIYTYTSIIQDKKTQTFMTSFITYLCCFLALSPGHIEADGTLIRSWKGRCGLAEGVDMVVHVCNRDKSFDARKFIHQLRATMLWIKYGLTMDSDFHIFPLTLLLLLRVGHVKFPPLLSSWSHVSTQEMEDLHEVACLCKHKDENAVHVWHMLQSSYDWHSLTKAIPVLKQEWRFFLQRHIPLPVAVLAKTEVFNRRWQGPSEPFFDDTHGWQERCWHALETLGHLEQTQTSNFEETDGCGSHMLKKAPDVPVCTTPERPRKKSTAETPVLTYLEYIENGGPPSPLSCFDSPPTRKFKDWFRKQFQEEQKFTEVHAISDDDVSPPPQRIEKLHEPASSSTWRPPPSEPGVSQSGMTDQSFEDYDLLLTRQSEDYNGGVAQWSQEDPDVDDDLDVDDESPDSNSLMPVSARLRSLEDRSCAPRTFKFGSCPHHGTALRPHIWSASSKKAGRGALVCSKFWKRDETTNKPTCWYFKEVTLAEAQEWPRFYRKQHQSLQNRFLRGGRQD